MQSASSKSYAGLICLFPFCFFQHPIFESIHSRQEELKFDPNKDVSYSDDAAAGADYPVEDDHQDYDGGDDRDKSDEYIEYRTAHSAATGTVSQIT